jgi:hypothetical protein
MRNKKSRGVSAADTDGHEPQDSSRDDVDLDFEAHTSAGQPPLMPAKKSNKKLRASEPTPPPGPPPPIPRAPDYPPPADGPP